MKRHQHLILILFISMIFPLLAACDAEQASDTEKVATEGGADSVTTAPPEAAVATEPESTQPEPEPIMGWDDSMAGKYNNEKFPKSYLELKNDGTFVLTPDPRDRKRKEPYTGTFAVDGDQLTLSLGPRLTRSFRLEQGAVVTPRGTKFLK